MNNSGQRPARPGAGASARLRALGVIAAALLLLAGGIGYWWHARSLSATLLRTEPALLEHDPKLQEYATGIARPLYALHCASCHGSDMRGNPHLGAPNLTDSIYLYGNLNGDGDVEVNEVTLLYGIRSGHPKARNVTDMPAEGRTHQLNPTEVSDVVQYVLSISRRATDADAAERGRKLFYDKGNCFDCHGGDAQGNTDYGAPGLTGKVWNWGGDPQTLYNTIYNGRHGLCPAWVHTLKPAQIRALAVYLYVVSHHDGVKVARADTPGDIKP